NGDGAKTVRIWSKDSAGNVSASAGSVAMTLDQTPPTVTLVTAPSGLRMGGDPQTITWSASDANFGAAPIQLEQSADNGANWFAWVSNTVNDGSETAALPTLDSDQVRLRVRACDLAGNCAQDSSSALTIDSTSPAIGAFELAGGSPTTAF